VTFTIDASATSVCSIAGSAVSFIGVGNCVINANQAGDASYSAAPQVQQSIPVAKGDQTITLTSTAPVNAKVGGPTYNVTATASSGLAVTFTIAPSASAICTIAGSTVSFIGVGTCLVNANQPGDANWNAAPQVQQSFSVAKGDQTISFTSTAPVNAKVGGSTYNVTATATSGLPVTFTIDAPATSVCTIAGSTVSFIGAGTCVINANQAGNVNYNAAPQVQQSFTVSKGDQTISFTSTAPVGAKVGGPTYNVTATATSGLAVTFTIDPSASTVCTIAGSTVSFIGAGTCVINANQAGDANWNAAPQVQQSVAVAKGDQTITFNSTAPTQAKVGGSTYTVTATASSGLPVTFTIDASASTVCTIAGSTVSFIGSGTCVINANQAGNANYNAAPQVQQSFVVYQSPVITSANSTNFLATDPGTFTVTTIGFPSGASMVISETGALPNGVTFTNNNNGTATLAGTPAAGTQGDYSIVITADNGIAPAASQNFTLHVLNHAPQLTTNSVTYTTPGNTQLHVAGAILPGVASWADASGLLSKSGATDPDGPAALTVVPASGLTANGGSYSILADGRFTYVPAAGFTGTDTFSFGVTDTLDTTPGTINITVGTRVWYIRDVIDAQNAAGGDGRSTNPFDNIAAFNAATTNNGDIIFIFEGNTGTTPLTGSITLKDGQKLWGQGIALNVPSFGTSLVNAANKPRIRTTTASTDVVSVPATAGSRSNVEIRGLDLEATGVTSNAIDVTASGANTVGITISNNNFRGSTAEGIDLNAGGTAAFTATIQSNTITSAGNGIDTRVSATGTTTVMASNNMITSTAGNAFDARTLAGASALRVSLDSMNVAAAGTGILIDGSAAGTTTITSFSGNTVDGATVGTGISITSAIFDGTPGGTFQPFTAGNLSVGSGINSVGGPGVVLTNVQGDLSFTNLNIYAGGGAGLRVSSTTAYTGSAGLQLVVGAGGSNVEATNGPAVDVTQATVTLPFLSIKSTNSPTTGVALNSVAGTFSAGSGSSISGTSGTGFQVGSSSANVSYDGTITTTAGKGVDLTSNSGTIGFTGALTLSSGANTAFNATGGGTVTSTNTSSTLTSTTGTALNVANTTIGAGGLKFRSISAGTGASGPVSGIILNTTGSSGGLTVSGSGSAGSGGTIQRTTGPGISLTSTSNVSLSWMNVQNGGDDGIRGSNVTGFTLDRSTLSANGNAAGESGLDFAGLFGTASITNSTITGSAEDNAVIRNSSGTLSSLTVTGSTFSSNSSIGNDGLLIDLTGTANVTASVSSSTFTANRGDHFQGTAANSAVLNVTFSGNTLTGGHATALGQGITINAATAVPGFSGAVTYTLSNNSINGAILNAIQTNLGTSAAGATMSGTISNNVIGTAGSFQSCSTQGSGIGIDAHGNGTHTVVVSGNTIRQCFDRGITVLANDGSGTLNLTVTGNNSSHSDGTNSREGFFLNAGSADPNIFGVADAHFVCLNLGGAGALSNTLTHGPGASDDFRIRQRFSTTVRLPGYAGSATDTAAVVSYVLSRNSATAGSATVSSPPGGGFVGGVACPLP
jgi:hypothetical protein